MSQILLITSSPRAEASYSTRVAHALAKNLISKHRDSTLIVRDLAGDPPCISTIASPPRAIRRANTFCPHREPCSRCPMRWSRN